MNFKIYDTIPPYNTIGSSDGFKIWYTLGIHPPPGGTLDLTFGPNGTGLVHTNFSGNSTDVGYSIAIDTSNRILLGGYTNGYGSGNDFAIARYLSSGTLDLTFGSSGTGLVHTNFLGSSDDRGYSLVIDNNNRILLGGFTNAYGNNDFAIARYLSSGILDLTFNGTGYVITPFPGGLPDRGQSLVIDNNNRILLGGFTTGITTYFAIARYLDSGILDLTFNGTGLVQTSFTPGSINIGYSLIIDYSNNKILLGGYTTGYGNEDFAIARYLSTGALDPSFGTAGLVYTPFTPGSTDIGYSLVIDYSNNKILLGGYTTGYGSYDFAIARYLSNGTLDTSFGPSGTGLVHTNFTATSFDIGQSMVIDSSNRILLGGYTTGYGSYDFAIARYTINGILDLTFGTAGLVHTNFTATSYDFGYSLVIFTNNRILLGGSTDGYGTSPDFAIACYYNS